MARKPEAIHKDIIASSGCTSLELSSINNVSYLMKGPKSTMARDSESTKSNLLLSNPVNKMEKQMSEPKVQNLMPLKK